MNSSYNFHGFKFTNIRGTCTVWFTANSPFDSGCGTVTFTYQRGKSSACVDKKMINPSYVKFYYDSTAFYIVFYTPGKWDALKLMGSVWTYEVEEYFSNTEIPTGATQVTETAYPTT